MNEASGTTVAAADPVIVYAFWLGLGVAALAVLMLVVILVLRQVMQRRARVHAAAVEYWRTLLVPEPSPEPETSPPLRDRDMSGFLQAWNEVHDGLQGRTTPYLARLAREVNLENRAARRLNRGFHTRLVAMIALGNVHSRGSYGHIERYIDDKNPIVSLCAARALMQIDPQRAVSQFVPHIVRRGDWSPGSIATILSEAGAKNVERELAGAALQANVDIAPRLVRFLAGVSPEAAAPIIRKMLESSADERLISTCLQVMSRPQDLDLVRPLLAHQRWHVRMQAAVTLGRLGQPGDEQRLVPILADPQWWVRYRAAQALHGMPFIGTDGLRQIQAGAGDKYARDIIQQVLAEHAMGIVTRAAA